MKSFVANLGSLQTWLGWVVFFFAWAFVIHGALLLLHEVGGHGVAGMIFGCGIDGFDLTYFGPAATFLTPCPEDWTLTSLATTRGAGLAVTIGAGAIAMALQRRAGLAPLTRLLLALLATWFLLHDLAYATAGGFHDLDDPAPVTSWLRMRGLHVLGWLPQLLLLAASALLGGCAIVDAFREHFGSRSRLQSLIQMTVTLGAGGLLFFGASYVERMIPVHADFGPSVSSWAEQIAAARARPPPFPIHRVVFAVVVAAFVVAFARPVVRRDGVQDSAPSMTPRRHAIGVAVAALVCFVAITLLARMGACTKVPVSTATGSQSSTSDDGGDTTASTTSSVGHGGSLTGSTTSSTTSGTGGALGTTTSSICVGCPYVEVSAGYWHTCARKQDGTLCCWGYDEYGELGNGTTMHRSSPVHVKALGTSTLEVSSVNALHTCARKQDGTLWCWGSNDRGQLGDGTTAGGSLPVQVKALGTSVAEVSVGVSRTCARKQDGTLWCWGNGFRDDGTTTPVQVKALGTSVVEVSAGVNHICARKQDGTLWCWGSNRFGQLGVGTTERLFSPVQVTALDKSVVGVAVGAGHTCARKQDGTLWCWGSNQEGGLGDGTTTDRSSPVQVTALGTSVVEVAAGAGHTCARKQDGTLWCWGHNTSGQLGVGTTTDRSSPVQVKALDTSAVEVSAGGVHTCARKQDGTVWCWGSNQYGELGDGHTTGQRSSPVQVGTCP